MNFFTRKTLAVNPMIVFIRKATSAFVVFDHFQFHTLPVKATNLRWRFSSIVIAIVIAIRQTFLGLDLDLNIDLIC